MLTSIELTGFRGFRQLKLEGLKRVNLIVGKNNSGKTSLLEGICSITSIMPMHAEEVMARFRHKTARSSSSWIWNKGCKTKGCWLNDDGRSVIIEPGIDSGPHPHVSILPVFQLDPDSLVALLGKALLEAGTEHRLEELLRRVDSRIRRIRIDASDPKQNQIVLDVGLPKLIPITEMGQGVYRLIEIISEIVVSQSYVCLIDEIENGLHHSSLLDIWRGVALLAQETGVQIFATTHSHECIEAAHEAFSEREIYDFSIVQLFQKTVAEQGRVLHQEHIAAAMAGEIDLRG